MAIDVIVGVATPGRRRQARRCLLHPLMQPGHDLGGPVEAGPKPLDVGNRVELGQVGELGGQQRVGLE
jgi:hypothetical protein